MTSKLHVLKIIPYRLKSSFQKCYLRIISSCAGESRILKKFCSNSGRRTENSIDGGIQPSSGLNGPKKWRRNEPFAFCGNEGAGILLNSSCPDFDR